MSPALLWKQVAAKPMKIHHCFKQMYINVPFEISVIENSNRTYLHFILLVLTWIPLGTFYQCLVHFKSEDFFLNYTITIPSLFGKTDNVSLPHWMQKYCCFFGDFLNRKTVWISTQTSKCNSVKTTLTVIIELKYTLVNDILGVVFGYFFLSESWLLLK